MSLHKTDVQNCPLLFRLRPAQINDSTTKSVFHSRKGPSREEAELFGSSCFLPPCRVEIWYLKANKLYCSNTVLRAAAPHSVTIAEWVSTNDTLIPKTRRQEHPQSAREMMVTVSKSSKTHIYQAIKSRPHLYKPGTGTTPLKTKA